MRLIDVDVIKTVDYSGLAYISPNDYHGVSDYFYKQLIINQPTKYDINEVIKQLENGLDEILYDRCFSSDYYLGMKDVRELIEKVFKGGGVE